MPDRSPGTLTILFTDLEDHTTLYRRLGEAPARDLILSHFRLLRAVIAEHGGREVKSEGDRLMVVFPGAGAAIQAAVAMQQCVVRANRAQPHARLSMRVGLHSGEPQVDGDDLYGTPVIVAERLCDQAAGGQIVVSEVVKLLAGLGSPVRFAEEQVRQLKGIAEPVGSYLVLWDEGQDGPALGRSRFVGRERERAVLMGCLDAARQGRGSLVFLAGEPGIGKTRLALEVAASAGALACHTFIGQAYDMKGTPPFLPFTEALRDHVRTCDSAELVRHLGDQGPVLADLIPLLRQRIPELGERRRLESDERASSVYQYLIFEAVSALLGNIAREVPVLLFLDELQWADQESLSLLQHLARGLAEQPILAVGAYRDAEVDQSHPLTKVMGDLGRRRLYQLITLKPLEQDEHFALLAGLVGEEPSSRAAAAIYRRAEGNPFFVEEIVAHLVEQGISLTDPEATEGDWAIPETVRQLIGTRLGRLEPETQDMLTAASILGDPFSFEEIQSFSSLAPEPLVDTLDAALRAGMLRESGDGYEFSHALIGETLLGSLTKPRYQRLHLRAARALEERYAGNLDEYIAELAYHHRQAGPLTDPATVLRHCTRAGDLALQVHAYEKATEHYGAALAAGDKLAQFSAGERADLLLKLGHIRRGQGSWGDALARYTEAAACLEETGDRARLAEIFYARGHIHAVRGEPAAALELLAAAKAALPDGNPQILSRVLVQEAQSYVIMRRYPQAEAAALDGLRLAEQTGDDSLCAEALFASGYGSLMSLHMRQAAAAFRLARSLCRRAKNTSETWRAATATRGVIALMALGELAEATEWAEEGLRALERIDNPYQQGWARLSLATVASIAGDLAEGEAQALSGFEQIGRTGHALANACLAMLMTQICCYRADFTAAQTWASRLTLGDNRHGRVDAATGGWGFPLLVQATVEQGGASQAAAALWSGRFDSRRPDVPALLYHTAVAEIALLTRDAALGALPFVALRELYGAGTLFTVGWPALVPRLLGGICSLRGEWEMADRYLTESLAIATRLSARAELALTHLEYAWLSIDRRGARRGAALEHMKAADTLAQELGMDGLQARMEGVLDRLGALPDSPAARITME